MTQGVPRQVQVAVTAAERDIASLALQADQIHQRIATLQGFIEHCRNFGSIVETTVSGTYAEAAMNLLSAAGRPMRIEELVDAFSAAGRPVKGLTRKHRKVTLTISLKRARSIVRTSRGYWLRGVPMPSGNAHGS
jgi:hypothetical protein